MKQLLGSVEVPAPVSAADRSDREGGAPILSNPDLVSALDRCYHMGTRWNLALMELVAQAERRNLPAEEGLSSITDWLCARFGLGYTRTSELVEIAMALEELPQLRRAYREGRVSYDHLQTHRVDEPAPSYAPPTIIWAMRAGSRSGAGLPTSGWKAPRAPR